MANSRNQQKRNRDARERHRRRRTRNTSNRSRTRAKRRPAARQRTRAQRRLGAAQRDAQRATTNLYRAGENVLEAGEAGVAAAREVVGDAGRRVADVATTRVTEATETARDRASELAIEAGRSAVGVGSQLLALPELVREGAWRGVEAIEETGARAAVSVIDTGTKMLNAAAEYVSELAPRRRLRRSELEQFIIEQLRWAHMGTEAYDRTVDEADDAELRTDLVRFKLQTIKRAETLMELLRSIGGRVPSEEAALPPPSVPGRNGHHRRARGRVAVREGLGHALTVAVQTAEGCRALGRIATWAENDDVSRAILRASASMGAEPDEQVTFLRQALLDKTVESILH
jgi:hypothetical protein